MLYERLRMMPLKPGRLADTTQARLHRPAITTPEARGVLAVYGLELLRDPANLATGWRNDIVVVSTNAGRKVLKRHLGRWEPATVLAEHSVLLHLARHDFNAPRLETLPDGKTVRDDGNAHWSLFDFAEGVSATGRYLPDRLRFGLLRRAGVALASFHQVMAGFEPAGSHHLEEDPTDALIRLEELRRRNHPLVGPMLEEAGEIEQRLESLTSRLVGAPLRRLVVHGDFGLHNLLFQQNDQVFVHDFELSHVDWRLVDLVVALSRMGVRGQRELAEAYRRASGVDDEEWRLLPTVWEYHRLNGAIRAWDNYLEHGDERRLATAARRLAEAGEVAHKGSAAIGKPRTGYSPIPGEPRVLMVVRLFHPWIGGTERQAQKLAKQLDKEGVGVQISTGRWFRGTKAQEVLDGVAVHRNNTLWEFFGWRGLRKFGGYLYMATLLWHLIRRRKTFDVIHVHGLNYHTAVAVIAGRLLRKPVVTKLANSGPASDIRRMRDGRQLALSRLFLPTALRSDRFVALNPAVVDELLQMGVAPDRIQQMPNGVESPPPPVRTSDGPTRIIYLGRLHPQKGLETLLEAASDIHNRRPDLKFDLTLVGDGPDRSRLEALAVRLRIDVEFAGATVDASEHLASAGIFVLPSYAEGLSNSLLEAMAAGACAVVSAIPGNLAVVTPEWDGLVFEPGDTKELAAILIRVLDDAGLRDSIANRAVETIRSRFTIEAVAGRYRDLYTELRRDPRVARV